jgi:hypothetical protein
LLGWFADIVSGTPSSVYGTHSLDSTSSIIDGLAISLAAREKCGIRPTVRLQALALRQHWDQANIFLKEMISNRWLRRDLDFRVSFKGFLGVREIGLKYGTY